MGNEALRSTRSSASKSSFRRSRRHSKNGGQNHIAEEEVERNNQELTTPKPSRGMDRIRRSLSFRRKKKSSSDKASSKLQQKSEVQISNSGGAGAATSSAQTNDNNKDTIASGTTANNTNTTNNDNSTSRPTLWIEDEKRVRAGNCSFQVKYLGFQEVSDSRGMHVCETAIEKLLAEKDKKRPIKAILYVSGDSLRVVDESNKTLLVDQTIEKVSFCAPDRHHENGFAYICRDGTARRWLCHGFMAIKETLKGTGASGSGCSGGERLSHAVGCAFSVCLEKKQKRERENVSMEVGPNHSFTRFGSFRQASLTERFEDPQMVMPAAEPVPIKQVENPHAIERPKANLEAFNRQNPLRNSALSLPFKRNSAAYTSLKPGELPSFKEQKLAGFNTAKPAASQQPISKTSLLTQQYQKQSSQTNSANETNNATPVNSINSNSNNPHVANTINTISELPEEQSTDQISKINNNNTLMETLRLTENLHINPAITATTTNTIQQSSPQIASATANATTTGWAAFSNQPTQYNQLSSVFTTPVTPVTTNSTIPPPLPPMPTQLHYQQQQQYFTTNTNNTPLMQMFHTNMPMNMMTTPQATPSLHNPAQASITPILNANLPPNNVLMSSSLSAISSNQNTPMYSPNSSLASANANETFEQKWARIQAAKKTNPFAEDIAKKFEIKL